MGGAHSLNVGPLRVSAVHFLIYALLERVQVPATMLEIIGPRIGRHALDNSQRSYFVTCCAFLRLVLGFVPLLLYLGACCKSVI